MRPDAGQNDGGSNRLVNEVDRTQFKTQFLIRRFHLCGQKNDRRAGRGRISLQAPAYFIAIHLRHHDVEQYQIRHRCGCQRQALHAVVGQLHPVMFAEQLVEQTQVGWRVINHQNGGALIQNHDASSVSDVLTKATSASSKFHWLIARSIRASCNGVYKLARTARWLFQSTSASPSPSPR